MLTEAGILGVDNTLNELNTDCVTLMLIDANDVSLVRGVGLEYAV